jgi:hypothetical protein
MSETLLLKQDANLFRQRNFVGLLDIYCCQSADLKVLLNARSLHKVLTNTLQDLVVINRYKIDDKPTDTAKTSQNTWP